MNNYKLYDPNF